MLDSRRPAVSGGYASGTGLPPLLRGILGAWR